MRLRFVKYRFMRYRFVRYWFRPWLDADIPSKHFVCLQDVFKMSSKRYQDMPSIRLQDMLSRRLQDVFSITIFRLPIRLEDVFKTSSRRICKTSWKTKNCYAEDMLKTSSRHGFKTSWRPTNVCWDYCYILLNYTLQ